MLPIEQEPGFDAFLLKSKWDRLLLDRTGVEVGAGVEELQSARASLQM
jgi:hypothetical protein